MQFSVNPDKIAIYDSIQQNYMLLYIHDIEEFELEDIQVLACNLEAKLQLT